MVGLVVCVCNKALLRLVPKLVYISLVILQLYMYQLQLFACTFFISTTVGVYSIGPADFTALAATALSILKSDHAY